MTPPKPLHDFVEEVSGQSHLRVEHDFGDGFVRLHTSEAERRQAAQDITSSENILLELMRNSKDAHGSNIFIALSKEGSKRIITIIDDGDGIPLSMHEHVFEPRVTSKLDTSHRDAWGYHGRGMALYSIKVNTEEAKVITSEEGLGSSIRIISDTSRLSERTDQSSFPTFELQEGGKVQIRGPKNLLRTACEFAIECRDSCSIRVGSPAEIASALYAFGIAHLSAIDRAFCDDPLSLPISKRLAVSADPAELARACMEVGLDISERTARRIIDGQIAPARPLLDRIVIDDGKREGPSPSKGSQGTKTKGRTGTLRLGKPESEALAQATKDAFEPIAESYYLEKDIEPSVRVRGDALTITIPLITSS